MKDQEEKLEADEPISAQEVILSCVSAPALGLILLASIWEALHDNYALAFSNAFIGMYLVSVVYEQRLNPVVVPLVGAGLFLLRDLVVRLSQTPVGVDLNLIGAAWCFLEAARTLYVTNHANPQT